MSARQKSIGPWLLGCVAIAAATVLVLTGHGESVAKTFAAVVVAAFLLSLLGNL